MAVPKNRLSQTRQKMRRANWKLTAPGFVECQQCHEAVMPHHVCPTFGYYKGKPVVNNTTAEYEFDIKKIILAKVLFFVAPDTEIPKKHEMLIRDKYALWLDIAFTGLFL